MANKSASPTLKKQYFKDDGNPAAGYLLYTYAAGTLVPLATYTDYAGLTPNANPIVLDSAGRADIWFSAASYKLVLKTAAGVVVWTQDNQIDPGNLLVSQLADSSNVAYGDALVAYKAPYTGSVARTVHAKFTDYDFDIVDFGADPTGVVDATAIIQAVIDQLPLASGQKHGRIFCPPGNYKVTGTLEFADAKGVQFIGAGVWHTKFIVTNAGAAFNLFHIYGIRDCLFADFGVTCSAAAPLDSCFYLETKSGRTQTNNIFERIDIEATDAGGMTYGFRGVTGSGGDNNNDGMTFNNVAIRKGVKQVSVEHRQAKSWRFTNCEMVGLQGTTQYLWFSTHGSFQIYNCQGSAANIAVLSAADTNDPGIVMQGNGFEDCACLCIAGTGGASGANFSVVLIGNRFTIQSAFLAADKRVLQYFYKGPLFMVGNQFGGTGGGVEPAKFYINHNQNNLQDLGRSIAIANDIESTLVDPFINDDGTSAHFTEQIANTNRIAVGSASYGLPNVMRNLSLAQGSYTSRINSQAVASDFDPGLNPELIDVSGTGTITGIKIPTSVGFQTGQKLILKVLGGPTITFKHNTAPSAGYAKLKLYNAQDFIAGDESVLTLVYESNQGFWIETGRSTLATFMQAALAAANDFAVPLFDGPRATIHVTGATTINGIASTGRTNGSMLTLIFDSTPTVKHNTAPSAGYAKLLLSGSADLVAAANTVLNLVYDSASSAWQEVSRKVA